ncbi:MAG: FAD-dependent oxidoreductase, partial [Acidimicrobiales bacterium]
MSTHVVVIGGGITGLTTAYHLSKKSDIHVTVLESSNRLGGKIKTTDFHGRAIEEGADAFIVRVPFALDLCAELGLADEIIHPETSSAGVYVNGHTRNLTQGLVVGIPPRLLPMLRCRLVSLKGMA